MKWEQTVDQFFPDALFPQSTLPADTASVSTPQYNIPVVNADVPQSSGIFVTPNMVSTVPPATAVMPTLARPPVPATVREMPPGKTHTGDLNLHRSRSRFQYSENVGTAILDGWRGDVP